MTALDVFLNSTLARLEAAGADALDFTEATLRCEYEVVLDLDAGDTPEVVAHAQIRPGGQVEEIVLVAREDRRVARLEVPDEAHLVSAVQRWFDEQWWGWDEVLEVEVPDVSELLTVTVADLRAGDVVWRVGRKVTLTEKAGTNTGGEPLFRVRFEGTTGTEVWPTSRPVTVLRGV